MTLGRWLTQFLLVLLAGLTTIGVVACDRLAKAPTTGGSSPSGQAQALKVGVLLPITGDLSAFGEPMVKAIEMAVETANGCGGVLGQPVQLVKEDDRTSETAGAEAMNKLATIDKVGAVVGAFGSGISSAALAVAVPNQVVMVSPASTSTVFTERAQKGEFQDFWNRTAPPDTYQAAALAKLAYNKGFRKVSTIVINNDYGVSFEKVFVETFKSLGGEILNEQDPSRYDPKATTFEAEVRKAFGNKPEAVAAALYPDTGAAVLKSAYELGLLEGVQLLLTDGVQTEAFPKAVGTKPDGKMIIAGALGTVPGADGKGLEQFQKDYEAKYNQPIGAFVPHAYDATTLILLGAEAAKSNQGAQIKTKIREVAAPPGAEVTNICEALQRVREGQDINYQGVSGNVDLDSNGDVQGAYDVWTVEPDGKIKIVDRISA
ncbi:MAG: ABC transporter substrate-binding protein [Pseudanabaenaceae cyanobacterium SKYGB_i_bin29]|nr:ABC transporter substrate-binding protein [Pseudanabaenaceae cyanobacterium SKYG29]MDW8420600.1 ABC transporter substrate-binding protein [Pseudanabaenaceae cyanobacterium SKYGB_i_bin29]